MLQWEVNDGLSSNCERYRRQRSTRQESYPQLLGMYLTYGDTLMTGEHLGTRHCHQMASMIGAGQMSRGPCLVVPWRAVAVMHHLSLLRQRTNSDSYMQH